jgi:hypothetical protein
MAGVVSVPGDGGCQPVGVGAGETNASEPLKRCRKFRDVAETGLLSVARERELGGSLLTARAATGIETA